MFSTNSPPPPAKVKEEVGSGSTPSPPPENEQAPRMTSLQSLSQPLPHHHISPPPPPPPPISHSLLGFTSCLSSNNSGFIQLKRSRSLSLPSISLSSSSITSNKRFKITESDQPQEGQDQGLSLDNHDQGQGGVPGRTQDPAHPSIRGQSQGQTGTTPPTSSIFSRGEDQQNLVFITQPPHNNSSQPTSTSSTKPCGGTPILTFDTSLPIPPSPSRDWVSENLAVVQSRAISTDSSAQIRDTSTQDWQAGKTGVRERNAAMCNNDLMSDVYFVVSSNGGGAPVTFPAHKYVLATGSSVFFAMFFGSLAETGTHIVVPDVEPDSFLKMLKYLYADEIDLDEESVLPTLHVAKKYIIPHLAKACVQFMEASLTARNACILLCQSRIYSEELDLMQRCNEVIDAQAELALTSEGFPDIDHSTLISILGRETLNCREISVFEAALAWAAAECERMEVSPTDPANLRKALGSALALIRVPTMDLGEFADGPAQAGIWTLEECHDMWLHFTATVKPKLAYPTVPRAGLKPQVCHRFQSSAYRSNQWRYRGRCDSIQFMVDRRIFIVGFGLYGSSTGATTYGVHIELKRQGRILAENNTEFFSDGSSNTFHVYFQQPVQIDPDIFYTASAILDGMELSYFGQEGMTDVAVGPVAFQFQCSSESTNGTGVQGGQIPELIFYGPTPTPPSPSPPQPQSIQQQQQQQDGNKSQQIHQ